MTTGGRRYRAPRAMVPVVIVGTSAGYRVVCCRCGPVPGVRPYRSEAWDIALGHDLAVHT